MPAAVRLSAMRRPRTDVLLPLLGFGVPFLAVLLAIVLFDPYYGIVDDASLLGLVAEVRDRGFGTVYAHSVWNDISGWGMVRPFYWGLAYGEYRIGAESPTALYARQLARDRRCAARSRARARVGLPRAMRGAAPSSSALYGAAVFVFPWTLDLFAFPSYQEKWVILGAALALLVVRLAAPRASGLGVVRDQRARPRRRRRDEGAVRRLSAGFRAAPAPPAKPRRGVVGARRLRHGDRPRRRRRAAGGRLVRELHVGLLDGQRVDAASGPPLLAALRARRRVGRLRARAGRARPRRRSGST